jgi:Raf kinase inhibitor-like YbhB/YbcL family protein
MVSHEHKFKLFSKSFNNGDHIPKKYTGQGEDINPHLHWESPPKKTKSYALIVDDPDAPVGLFTHWLVKNIPETVKEIQENSIPGEEVESSWKVTNWKGPMPPSGDHRYYFKLYALDKEKMDAKNLKEFYEEVKKHQLGEAVLMGKYRKH